ncbi:MAG: T9SS type A sorting domain-containing protein, partial [Bacteroidales bacterium]|nr:T9SS type A sorting domain-containing protein [Bacteroidales bacterium]MCF0200470.1 T9SS type A sorting domain-containing protein [Bacteroidales bacterium]MCF0201420.1 T9SS type A sorting domain-containing protein [Bacteroidales bacterium]
PETQYTIYALPIAANGTFFPVRKAVATTLPAPAPGTSVIALEVQVLNWDAAQTTATPNEETVTFHVGVMTKEHFDEIGEFAAVQAIRNDNSPLTGTDVHTWNELEAETVYYAIATGKNEAGEWGETSIVAFATGPDSVAAYDAVAFEAYPNPANESVKIVGGNINSVEVFNSFGQKVDAIWATGTEALISTQSLENGIYFVRINGNAVVRIVVRH